MGEMIELTTSDGHKLAAYRAHPVAAPKAGIVVVQEIFGVTGHIKRVTDQFASHGYLAIAPSLFDRVQSDVVLEYTEIEKARETMQRLDLDDTVVDMAAAAAAVRSAGKVGAVGYCWGGAIADLAACRIEINAAVAYYGRMIVEWLDLKPACPVMYHFGDKDQLIPSEMVAEIRDARPDGVFYTYPEAGHGFSCDERPDYRPESAKLALDRTLDFFGENL
jgi:carboxymethylenebutenolidase